MATFMSISAIKDGLFTAKNIIHKLSQSHDRIESPN